jgi:DNA invertase Pin-like site-specific DNA recombinase
MRSPAKVRTEHLSRKAYIYVRQSSPGQVVNHPEGARRQRDLVKLAVALGWPASKIVVLDADQGKTGRTATGREAFKRMLGDVSFGEVGIVIGLEVARLARNGADWFPLVEMCSLTATLIADEEGVYDANEPNDRLVLGLKGTLSEAELYRIRARLQGARWSLARRGELRRKIPTGYVWDERGRVVMDPDERVRASLRAFFSRFEEVGSACGVARAYAREGLSFPSRDFRGRWNGSVRWGVLGVRQATRLLHNPFFAGAYFYGERRATTTLDPETRSRKTVLRRHPLEEWEVLIRDSHPAYLSWEQYLRNQERLQQNWTLKEGGTGAARSGATLLQGIAYCGSCARHMAVRYSGRTAYPSYICNRHTKAGEWIYCQSVPASGVDRFVSGHVLDAIQPAGIQAALSAIEELEKRSQELRRQWEHRIAQAEYEAKLARKRYEAVDPDNRLVARNLEADWEDKLRALDQLREEFAERSSQPPMKVTAKDRELLRGLAKDLPRLWHAKSTKASDRKKIVRILIRDVWLVQQDEPRQTNVQIHWQSGAVTQGQLERPFPLGIQSKTPVATANRIQQLDSENKNSREIAETLNREGLKTAHGSPFTAARVRNLLYNRRRGPRPQTTPRPGPSGSRRRPRRSDG